MLTRIVDSPRSSAAAARPPRLALRFAIYTGIAVVLAGVAMLQISESVQHAAVFFSSHSWRSGDR